MLDIIDSEHWYALLHDPRSERFFDALIAEDDTARANGDTGGSLDDLLRLIEQTHRAAQ